MSISESSFICPIPGESRARGGRTSGRNRIPYGHDLVVISPRLWLLLRPTSCIHAVVLGQLVHEGGVVCFDEMVEQGLPGLMAFVGSADKALPTR